MKKGPALPGLFLACLLSARFAVSLPAPSQPSHPTKPDYSKEPVVIENFHMAVQLENNGTETRERTVRVRVQSDAGVKAYGLLAFGYNSANERLEIKYVKVIKPDGTIVSTPATNIQDATSAITRAAPMYSDYREKHVAVEGLDVGDEVEYSSKVRTIKPLIPGQFWFDFNFSKSAVALHEEFEVSIPKGRKVIVKSPSLKPAIAEKSGRRIYTWKTSNLKDKTGQQARPGYLPPPSIEITSFQNWEQVGRWWGRLEWQEAKPTPAIRAEALELTRNATTDQEKVHAIYKYVSEQFRYISISFGIGRYRPHAAADVLRNQYGDCKDKHTLLASLLQAVGLSAYPALISATNKINPDVPSPGQFDHVISDVPLGQKGIWLDTTAEVAPEGFLMPTLRDKQALVIPNGKPPHLETTPSAAPFQSFVHFKADGKLSSDGTFTGKIQRTAHGYVGVALRLIFRDTSESKWQELAQGISQLTGFGGKVSDVTTSPTDDIDHPFQYSYSYIRKNYGDWADRKIVPALPPFGMVSEKESKGKSPKPIYFNGPTDFHYTSSIKLPKGYTPQLPKAVDLKLDFADYHSTYTFKDGVLTADRDLSIKTDELPSTRRKDYLKLQNAVKKDEDQFITLNQPSTAPAVNPQAMKLYRQAVQAVQIQDLNGAHDLLQQALSLDPKFERAWVGEGTVYMMRGEYNEGSADLRKAIALNPKDPRPYAGLVEALRLQGKQKEAIKVLREMLKQVPNDSRGHLQLGLLLVDAKQYSEATKQPQTALAAHPGSPLVEMSLARAYAGMGDGVKAADTFSKAVATDPEPRVWKAAANSLSKFGQELPEAQHYAELAVKADESKSARLTIATAGSYDLRLMGQMAADWDVLGRVYFKERNLTAARKYLEAAWNLSQSGAIGDDLGQVYEKLGDRQLAIKMYAMATESSPLATSDAHSRLSRLLGDQISKVSDARSKASYDIVHDLKVELGRISSAEGSAEFLVLFSPGPKVDGLKFTSGDQQLKKLGNVIRSARFHILFPDNTPTKILQHGVLVCVGRSFGCDVTLSIPDMGYEFHVR